MTESRRALSLAALLAVAGAAHFVVPRSYERIVPGMFDDPGFWVRWSGVAELACAGLVAHPRTRRLGGYAAAGVFVVVFPANVKMAIDGGVPYGLAWARLPLQVPLIWWALRVAGGRRSPMRPAPPARSPAGRRRPSPWRRPATPAPGPG